MRRRQFITLLGGAAVAWPVAARAQQATPVIGFLHPQTAAAAAPAVAAFLAGLATGGFVEGSNVAIEYRFAEGHEDRLPSLAADLVRRRVDVIAAPVGDSAALAIKSATTTIPVVSAFVSDPVRGGFVDALTHPGRNFTGVYRFGSELEPKRLEILCAVVPDAVTIDLLVNPQAAVAVARSRDVAAVAHLLGRQIRMHGAEDANEIDEVFASLPRLRSGALLIMADSYFAEHSRQIGELASRYGIPAMFTTRAFAAAGGLMSYAADESDTFRLLGGYAGRILKGERPSDMPVQQSAKIELTVNRKSAKALGITVPPELLAGAAEIIE